MGGTLRFLSDVLLGGNSQNKKRKQFSTVELKVRMDCDGCELKVRNTLATMKGAILRRSTLSTASLHNGNCDGDGVNWSQVLSPWRSTGSSRR